MSTYTAGPAFPGLHPSDECRYAEEGMTLRDYFAAKAMQGLMLRVESPRSEDIAWLAYEAADAMLKVRRGKV